MGCMITNGHSDLANTQMGAHTCPTSTEKSIYSMHLNVLLLSTEMC